MATEESNTILIIDDNSDIVDVLSTVLRAEGYQVNHHRNANCFEAIKKMPIKPAAILLDVLMSGTDGRELCKKIKQESTTKKIPVIMFSAYPHVEKSTYDAGADAFLSKPFGRKELLQTLEKLMD